MGPEHSRRSPEACRVPIGRACLACRHTSPAGSSSAVTISSPRQPKPQMASAPWLTGSRPKACSSCTSLMAPVMKAPRPASVADKIQRLRQVAGLEGDHAIALGVLAVLPEGAVEARRQHHHHVGVGEPVLLGDHVHHERAQPAVRPASSHRRRQRLQRVLDRLVVVQARRDALDVLHDQVALHRMQAAAGGHVLLQEHGVIADPYFGLGGEHALQQLCEQLERHLAARIEIAAGDATRQQFVEVGGVRCAAAEGVARRRCFGTRPRQAARPALRASAPRFRCRCLSCSSPRRLRSSG